MKNKIGKLLKIVGIIFFGLTALINLLGGIGTSCAAFLTEQYPNYMALIEQGKQWLYQGLVITTVIVGLAGIWILIELILGKQKSLRNAIFLLAIGTALAGIQFYFSQQLFGKAAPANMKFYFNLASLILFLIFLIPGLAPVVNFSSNEGGSGINTSGGLVAVMMGITLLTTPIWAGPSHSISGENWVVLLENELILSGSFLLITGTILVLRRVKNQKYSSLSWGSTQIAREN